MSKHQKLGTERIGDSKLVVVSPHLRYRVDQVRFPNGTLGEYTYIDDDYAASAVVPFDNRKGSRNTLLIRQERYPSQSIGWEIPAGRPEKNETPEQAAKRELEEEAGITADHWHQLPRQFENIGRGNSRSDLFVASGVHGTQSNPDLSEIISDVRWFPMRDVEEMILDGGINSGHTIASLSIANTFVDRNPEHPISKHAG